MVIMPVSTRSFKAQNTNFFPPPRLFVFQFYDSKNKQRHFVHVDTGNRFLYSWLRASWVFPGGKERPERDADPSPPSSAVVMKGQSYTSTPPIGRTACTEPQCLYRGALYHFTFTYVNRNSILIRFNKMQQYAGIYLLQNHSLHVSGVHRTHHHEYIKL